MTTSELRKVIKEIEPGARVSKVDDRHWTIRVREEAAVLRGLAALNLKHDPVYDDLEGSLPDWIYVFHVYERFH